MASSLLKVLIQLQLLSPAKLFRFAQAARQDGINLMLLFSLTIKSGSGKIALVDSRETLTYAQLNERCENLSVQLKEQYNFEAGQKVAFFCRNHASLVQALFAASRLGAKLFLLNSSMTVSQFNRMVEEQNFDFLIYDEEFTGLIESSNYAREKLLSYHENKPAVSSLVRLKRYGKTGLKAVSGSQIVLLTGGTTGKPKQVVHQPSIFTFVQPFCALLDRLRLSRYQTAFIATPLYHGYGIAILLALFALGKKVVIQDRFEVAAACSLIREHRVEVATVVPLIVHKLLQHNAEDLRSLKCIASGGAKLNPILVEEVKQRLGNVLYNLYGTSEAGLNMIATPEDLACNPDTLGRLLRGGKLKVMADGKETENGVAGKFVILNSWSMKNRGARWIDTGDTGYRDSQGYYFFCGRTDDVIVCAGNNIHPLDVEAAAAAHPFIADIAVIGIKDAYRGQSLKAFVQCTPGGTLDEKELAGWLRTQLADFQVPREIVFVDELPYTSVGKLDRKKLQGGELHLLERRL
ncbi:acyl-CoA synthetase (AMP-forming)/AMP-acid ligase II [Planomicrobium sp. HSC-17F08]|nr:acyl-CoA synthetase (AMP-forming)/AMP-acid ligase II [Planomicrobium sp. HSC-17F08]